MKLPKTEQAELNRHRISMSHILSVTASGEAKLDERTVPLESLENELKACKNMILTSASS
ncbi:MAG: hypothetical protein PHG36_05490 [Dehalococcoidia bacterium]|nr:hypothetical protein [Dehalococcoidia bacterium]